ncbi:unnamed protein product [Didymodactylos carnosus]|uniref:DUF659 domain-containing protein n=1 Tax=Didymodactylos carnosus TaxID=1234261 RepID=A0A8S2IHL9_9BILA|nr:unnamed protein product [Didymodactylos carnosus]CAF3733804.1 unnamed protein product [Didymodactylos carnosus]
MSTRKREATGLQSAPLTKRSKTVKETSGEDSSSAAENDSKYVSAIRKADVWEFATHNEQTGSFVLNRLAVISLCITTDVWSIRKQDSYFTLTGYYFEDDNLDRINHTILSFKSFNGSHTADRYVSKIKKELEKLNLESKILTMTTDGAANVKNMCTILETTNGIKPIYCVAHGLHLIICNALRLWPKQAKNKNYLM